MTSYNMEGPIFIVGMGRSGTTLLRMMLNAHSRIAIAPETHYFPLFWKNRNKYGNLNNDRNLERLWDDLSKNKYFRDLRLENPGKIFDELVRGARTHKTIFEKLLKEYAKQKNKPRWGEKTPEHLEYLEIILSFYPDAKVIHIVRDPRDVALSYKNVPWGSNNTFSTAKWWNHYMDIPKNCDAVNNKCFLEIRYEDLATKPEEMLKVICSFIGEKFEGEMLDFHMYSKNYMVQNEPWKNGVLKPITRSNIGKWRDELTKWEVEQIIVKCRANMIEKGYLLKPKKTSFINRCFLIWESLIFHGLWGLKVAFVKMGKIVLRLWRIQHFN